MPQALSSKPEPYRPTWIPGAKTEDYSIGWSYPPKDYAKWGELVCQWVKHMRGEIRQGRGGVLVLGGLERARHRLLARHSGRIRQAVRLHCRGRESAPFQRQGGRPGHHRSGGAKAAAFLRQFLEHCATAATPHRRTGAPLDFITYHAKGRPTVVDGHVRMGIAKNAEDVDKGYAIVRGVSEVPQLCRSC